MKLESPEKYLTEISEMLDNSDLHKFEKEWIKTKIHLVVYSYAYEQTNRLLESRK